MLKKNIIKNEQEQNNLSNENGVISMLQKNFQNSNLRNLRRSNFLETSSENTNLNQSETDLLKNFGLIQNQSILLNINLY